MAFIYAEGDAHLSGSAQVTFNALESQLPQLLSDFPAVAEELKTAFGGGAARVSAGSLEIVLDADMFGCAAQPEGAGVEPEGLVEGADASARNHFTLHRRDHAIGRLCHRMRTDKGFAAALLDGFYAAAISARGSPQEEIQVPRWKLACAEPCTRLKATPGGRHFLFLQLHRAREQTHDDRALAKVVHNNLKQRQELGHVPRGRSFVLAVDILLDLKKVFDNLQLVSDGFGQPPDHTYGRITDVLKNAGYTECCGNPLHLFAPKGCVDFIAMSTSHTVAVEASVMTAHALGMRGGGPAAAVSHLVPIAVSANAVSSALREVFPDIFSNPVPVPERGTRKWPARTRSVPQWRLDLQRVLAGKFAAPRCTPTADRLVSRLTRNRVRRTARARCQSYFLWLASPARLFYTASFSAEMTSALCNWNKDKVAASKPHQVSKDQYYAAASSWEDGPTKLAELMKDLPPKPDGSTRLFHGTSEWKALSILQNSVQINTQNVGDDFGPAFYMTPEWEYAFEYANYEGPPSEGQGAIVVFDIQQGFFAKQKCVVLPAPTSTNSQWNQVVDAGWNAPETLRRLLGDNSVVQGPTAEDPTQGARMYTASRYTQVALRMPTPGCNVLSDFQAMSEVHVVLVPFTPEGSVASTPEEHDSR